MPRVFVYGTATRGDKALGEGGGGLRLGAGAGETPAQFFHGGFEVLWDIPVKVCHEQ